MPYLWLRVGLALSLALPLSGCGGGSDSACARICTWMASCYSSAGLTTPPCPFTSSCTAQDQCRIDCYDRSSCDAVTKKNMAANFQLQACLSQCGKTPDLGPGLDPLAPPEGKVLLPEGGPPPDLPWMPDIYYPDAPPGPARAKFCNNLILRGSYFTATLNVGTSPNQWTAQAYTGDCSPLVPKTCPVIPNMTNPAVELLDGSQVVASGTFTSLTISNGEEWVFTADVDSSSQPTVTVAQFKPGYPCSTTDPLSP